MLKVIEILKKIYNIDWSQQIILECGANKYGDETSGLKDESTCWYVEPNLVDFNILKKNHKNVLN